MENRIDNQVLFNNQWVDRKHFGVYLFGIDKEVILITDFEKYKEMIASGKWFLTPQDIPEKQEVIEKKMRKQKNGSDG